MSNLPKVLIVEDEVLIALELETRLRDLGFPVVGKATSGPEALRLARTHSPDVALLDIRLSGGCDGIEIAKVLLEELAIPAVFVTACSDRATLDRIQAVAPLGYLLKPFDGKAIGPTLGRFWARHLTEQVSLEDLADASAPAVGASSSSSTKTAAEPMRDQFTSEPMNTSTNASRPPASENSVD